MTDTRVLLLAKGYHRYLNFFHRSLKPPKRSTWRSACRLPTYQYQPPNFGWLLSYHTHAIGDFTTPINLRDRAEQNSSPWALRPEEAETPISKSPPRELRLGILGVGLRFIRAKKSSNIGLMPKRIGNPRLKEGNWDQNRKENWARISRFVLSVAENCGKPIFARH